MFYLLTKTAALLIATLVLTACSGNRIDEKYENKTLASALEKIGSSKSTMLPLADLPGVIRESFACVLEPYRDFVDFSEEHAVAINAGLKNAKYIADEGYWAIVQYSLEFKSINVAILDQRSVRLDSAKHKRSPQCEVASKMLLLHDSSSIYFEHTEEKK